MWFVLYRLLPLGLERRLRERNGHPEIGVTHYVELRCPNTDETIATEQTEPVAVEPDPPGSTSYSTYDCFCADCDDAVHTFAWGHPAPLLIDTPESHRP